LKKFLLWDSDDNKEIVFVKRKSEARKEYEIIFQFENMLYNLNINPIFNKIFTDFVKCAKETKETDCSSWCGMTNKLFFVSSNKEKGYDKNKDVVDVLEEYKTDNKIFLFLF